MPEVSEEDGLAVQLSKAVDQFLEGNESVTSQELVTAFSELIIDVIMQSTPKELTVEGVIDQATKQAEYILKCLELYNKKVSVSMGVQSVALNMVNMYLIDSLRKEETPIE